MRIIEQEFYWDQQSELTDLEIVLDRFYNNLPSKPYYANGFLDSRGSKIAKKSEAVKNTHIQVNHPQWKKYIILDIDNPAAVIEWQYEKSHLPAPTLVIENTANGRAHFLFELVDAVSFTENSSVKAQNFYDRVVDGLTKAFDADRRYTGQIAKNPLSSKWRVSSYRTEPYHLKELVDKLDLDPSDNYQWLINRTKERNKAANDENFICGRNDKAFHTVRHIAYTDMIEFFRNGGRFFENWFNHVLSLVNDVNNVFREPMDYKEVSGIAKSISRFTWKHHAECEMRFYKRQQAKGRKGGVSRSQKYDPIRKEAKRLFRLGVPCKDIALKLQVSYRSILRYTAGLKRLKLLAIADINRLRTKAVIHKKRTKNKCDSGLNQVVAAKYPPLAFPEGFLKYLNGFRLIRAVQDQFIYSIKTLIDKHRLKTE
ncbi:replication initiation protein (plasmid) [Acinetobacter indicus]|uniref:replication initiation protein n=1 Tax=Acinetobacter indicus TaxID=756892 RepID=UPI001FA6E8F4|nr:replication initiation protein [Acinetobacter indicus]UNW11111.1 replication initiation protein [Acinetobacter indicus]